jgi:hypothetical protein
MTSTQLTMKTTRFALAALAAAVIFTVTASAQLTLDNFPTGNNGKNYDPSLTVAQSSVTHNEALPENSPLGGYRQTVFSIGGNTYGLTSKLFVGNNVLILESGFLIDSILSIYYGVNSSGKQTPLGLNLSAYSGLQLNFAGIASTENQYVIIEVWPSSGGYYTSEQVLNPNQNPYSAIFSYSSFIGSDGGTLTQSEASDINYIDIITEAGGSSNSFAITSFQAIN